MNATMTGPLRDNFTGRNDRYGSVIQPGGGITIMHDRLLQAVQGVSPYDVTGQYLSENYVQDAAKRLQTYRTNWQRFRGESPASIENLADRARFNLYRPIVSKRAAWLAGKGQRIIAPKGNEQVAAVVDKMWRRNGLPRLIRRTAKMMLITGDAFWYFSLVTAKNGQPLSPDKWYVRVTLLDPSYVFPFWTEDDLSTPSGVLIQFPYHAKLEDEAAPSTHLYSLIATRTQLELYTDQRLVKKEPNRLGTLPIIHMASDNVGTSPYGTSIFEDLHPFITEYNRASLNIGRIIDYHAEPTTVIMGGRLSDLQRGTGKIWSGLPQDAKIETLKLEGNLGIVDNQLKRLEEHIYRTARTPRIAYDSEGLSISNSSAIALQLLFQPLVEATHELTEDISPGIEQGSALMLLMHKVFMNEDLTLLADDAERALEVTMEFKSIIPRDEAAELDMLIKKKEAGLISEAACLRQLAENNDTERAALELGADRMQELVSAYEKARALNLDVPNLSGALVSSAFLNEELLDFLENVGNLSASQGRADGDSSESDPLDDK